MKKIVAKALVVALAAVSAVGITACTPDEPIDPDDKGSVTLVAFDAAGVVPSGGCDYYLCPEPAASTKIKGTASSAKPFFMAGSLQTLYGGENGYPQAVLVAKKSVIESSPAAVAQMITYMTGSASYLESVAPETVLSLLADKRTEGLAPSFNANNLTQEVIKNCSVRFTPASEGKAQVNEFLTKLIAVNANAASTVSDSFYYTGSADASAVEGTYSVYAPDGAPALSLIHAISKEVDHFNYHVVDPATIQTYVTGNQPTADFCVLPVNAASKLLGNGEIYQMLGTVTNGNIYFLSTGDNAVLTADNLSSLKGKRLGVVQLTNVPGLTLQAVLKRAGIEYTIESNSN